MDDELIQRLNDKPWYRFLKVLSWILLTLSFLTPWAIQEPSSWLVLDGLVNIVIGSLVVLGTRRVVAYIAFGRVYADTKRKQVEMEVGDLVERIKLRTIWVITIIVAFVSSGRAIIGISGLSSRDYNEFIVGCISAIIAVSSLVYLNKQNVDYKKRATDREGTPS